jgi:hypothetical protein
MWGAEFNLAGRQAIEHSLTMAPSLNAILAECKLTQTEAARVLGAVWFMEGTYIFSSRDSELQLRKSTRFDKSANPSQKRGKLGHDAFPPHFRLANRKALWLRR